MSQQPPAVRKLDAFDRMREAVEPLVANLWEVHELDLLGYHDYLNALFVDIHDEWTRRLMLNKSRST